MKLSPSPLVERVLPGSPAEQAGVMVGDRIVAIDEHQPKDFPSERSSSKSAASLGSQLSLKLDRAGRTIWSVMPVAALSVSTKTINLTK